MIASTFVGIFNISSQQQKRQPTALIKARQNRAKHTVVIEKK